MSEKRTGTAILWTRIFAVLLVSLGLATVITTAVIVIRSYSPYLFWDQWAEISFLRQFGSHWKLSDVWIQNNEHRIPIQLLLCLADLKYFGGTNKSLLLETFVIQCTHAALLTWVASKCGNLSRAVLLSVAGVMAYCLLSPLQYEVFYWGFEVTFVLVGLAASACFACAIYYSTVDPANSGRRNLVVAVAIGCCLVAEASLANGLLTWALLLVLAVRLKFAREHVWTIAAAAGVACFAYFHGYHSPPDSSNPLQTIRQPARVLNYVVALLSFSWDDSPGSAITWPRLSQSAALIAILVSVAGAIRCFRSRECSRLHLFVFSNLAFTLATAVITALGRLRFGYAQATASRYQSIALVFWASIGLLLASYAHRLPMRAVRWFQAAVIILLMSTIYRWSGVQTIALEHQAALKTGWVALSRHLMNDPAVLHLFPEADPLRQWFDFMQSNHLGPKLAGPTPATIEEMPSRVKLSGFAYRPDSCDGRVDQVVQSTEYSFFLTGWAYDFQYGTSDVQIAVASPQGKALGLLPSTYNVLTFPKSFRKFRLWTPVGLSNCRCPRMGITLSFLSDCTIIPRVPYPMLYACKRVLVPNRKIDRYSE